MRVETRPVLMLLPVWPDACNCPHLAADCSPTDSHLGARSNGKSHTLWDSHLGFDLLLVLVLVFSLCFALLDRPQPHAARNTNGISRTDGLWGGSTYYQYWRSHVPIITQATIPTIPDTFPYAAMPLHLFVAMPLPSLFCYKMKADSCLSGDLISIPACNTLPCRVVPTTKIWF